MMNGCGSQRTPGGLLVASVGIEPEEEPDYENTSVLNHRLMEHLAVGSTTQHNPASGDTIAQEGGMRRGLGGMEISVTTLSS